SRRMDETRRWVERGLAAARKIASDELLTRFLSLGATVANLRGDHTRAAAYLAEVERLAPRERVEHAEVPRGGRLSVALPNPVVAREPGESQTIEETEVLSNVFETLVSVDAQGNLVPNLCDGWALLDDGRTVSLGLRRDVHFSDGAPLTAEVVKTSLTRAIRL